MNYEISLPLEKSNNVISKFCIHEFTSEHQGFHLSFKINNFHCEAVRGCIDCF